MRKVVTSGSNTSFWFDKSSSIGTLRSHLHGPLNLGEEHQLVSHMIDNNGNWHFQSSFDLPAHTLNILRAVPVNVGTSEGDLIAWAFSNDGNFTLRSACIAAKGLNPLNPPTSHFSWIWKVKAPPKFIIFIWLCSYNSIPVREVLDSRGLNLDQRCPICKSGLESISHLLRECPHSISFWNQLGPPSSLIQSLVCLFQIGFTPTAPSRWFLGNTVSLGTFSSCLVFGPYGLTRIKWPYNSNSLTDIC